MRKQKDINSLVPLLLLVPFYLYFIPIFIFLIIVEAVERVGVFLAGFMVLSYS